MAAAVLAVILIEMLAARSGAVRVANVQRHGGWP